MLDRSFAEGSVERPRWATIVGVIGAILGAGGALGSAQTMFMPQMLENQRELFEQVAEAEKREGGGAFSAFTEEFFEFPEWFEEWSLVNGLVGVALSGGCLLASILLLSVRPGTPRLFVLFCSLSVLWHGVRFAVGAMGTGILAWGLLPGAVFGAVIHGVLIAVVLKSDQGAYAPQVPSLERPIG